MPISSFHLGDLRMVPPALLLEPYIAGESDPRESSCCSHLFYPGSSANC